MRLDQVARRARSDWFGPVVWIVGSGSDGPSRLGPVQLDGAVQTVGLGSNQLERGSVGLLGFD